MQEIPNLTNFIFNICHLMGKISKKIDVQIHFDCTGESAAKCVKNLHAL